MNLLRFFATLVALLASSLSASGLVRNVVVIYDERTALPGLAAIDASIISTLSKELSDPVQVYSEGMDLSRFGSEAHILNFREYLRAKYADRKVDVAIAVLGPPLDFLLSYGQTIFPNAAIVFCAVNESETRFRSLPTNGWSFFLANQTPLKSLREVRNEYIQSMALDAEEDQPDDDGEEDET